MTPRIRPLAPSELTAEQSALYAAITGGPRAQGPQHFALTAEDGSLRGPFDLMLRSPAVGTAQQELGAAIRYRAGFTDRSANWRSCWSRHAGTARSSATRTRRSPARSGSATTSSPRSARRTSRPSQTTSAPSEAR